MCIEILLAYLSWTSLLPVDFPFSIDARDILVGNDWAEPKSDCLKRLDAATVTILRSGRTLVLFSPSKDLVIAVVCRERLI